MPHSKCCLVRYITASGRAASCSFFLHARTTPLLPLSPMRGRAHDEEEETKTTHSNGRNTLPISSATNSSLDDIQVAFLFTTSYQLTTSLVVVTKPRAAARGRGGRSQYERRQRQEARSRATLSIKIKFNTCELRLQQISSLKFNLKGIFSLP